MCKVNPAFQQTELSRVDEQDYPSILKNRKLSSDVGYICEIRIQVGISLGEQENSKLEDLIL